MIVRQKIIFLPFQDGCEGDTDQRRQVQGSQNFTHQLLKFPVYIWFLVYFIFVTTHRDSTIIQSRYLPFCLSSSLLLSKEKVRVEPVCISLQAWKQPSYAKVHIGSEPAWICIYLDVLDPGPYWECGSGSRSIEIKN